MGKVLVITGGSRGIGAATAQLAAQKGYAVCINYLRNRPAAQSVVDEILASGGKAQAFKCDVSQEAEVKAFFEQVDREFGCITGLVNNAGILERQSRLESFDAARLKRIFETNVIGPFLCAKEAVLRMSTRHGGTGGAIVNVSSAAAKLGSPEEYVDYAASKAALETMTIGLAKEVVQERIRVNTVRPGVIYTEIHASGGEPNRVERVKTRIPMHRGGQPEEVAQAILWLLSDEASYTTGSVLEVSGGL
ncbi:MAG: SDR family oxidoreductase [Blastocatellia bacterium]|nr:SDR family oxidoreductase [Blastocatellia bacterium]